MATATLDKPTAPTKEHRNMKGLDNDLIKSLMGSTRTRNMYGPKLLEFMDSDEAAINPADVWPLEFGTKNTTTVYQGFLNAAKAAEVSDLIWIKQKDGQVYILHRERAILAAQSTNTDTDE